MTDTVRYRLAGDLVLRPAAGHVQVYMADGTYAEAGQWLLALAGELTDPEGFTQQDFLSVARELRHVPTNAWDILCACGIIRPSLLDGTPDSQPPKFPWTSMGWGMAQLLHEATVNTEFVQDDVDGWKQTAQVGSSLAAVGSGPPVTRDVDAFAQDVIDLKDPPTDRPNTDFFDVLINRRTRRTFNPSTRLTEQNLLTLLHFSARAHGSLRNPFFGDHILRTSPSGGARHPVEIYPQILRVDGFPQGNYHYDPVEHRLRRLGHTSNALLRQLGQNQSGCRNVPLAFIITARFSRNLWKYRYAKSFLFTYLDVGHFVQTLILCCQAVGLKTFLTPALNVKVAQQHLHLEDIYDECATYLVCAG
ncbi:hypothetical protein GCM10010103_64950 [Streptomyces paradoxus]|uniref:SagB-type dehydrogenase family enzyme n=2 Tax=Streptomyces paradoxus TaxID=66375 RepID=A0A7W9WLX7_9ACTN|nr:SagB-type dehydrogenase family enzyme [Streptomyces paradoxus]